MSAQPQPPRSIDMFVTAEVEVTIHNPEVVERVTGTGGAEWRASFYSLYTEAQVVGHFAYNRVVNGVTDISLLEGWGDCKVDDVTFIVRGAQVTDSEGDSVE